MQAFKSIEWREGKVRILDQRMLPHHTRYSEYSDWREVERAIQEMEIRGAPAIGIAAAFGVVLAAREIANEGSIMEAREELYRVASNLGKARPTAVNLSWAMTRMKQVIAGFVGGQVTDFATTILNEALAIYTEDIANNKALVAHGARLLPNEANVVHHCNTGALACADYGTALGVIRWAHEQGKKIHAFLDETRPRLQGASLSAWELQQQGVPHTVIVDSASGHLMRSTRIDACLVGCDRVAANGDTANKIGTYNLAIVARAHGVPFFVACPLSTIDLSRPTGAGIKIEERAASEITHIGAYQITPDETAVFNPAFDVTPAEYISAFITEVGVLYPPFQDSLLQAKNRSNQSYDSSSAQ